MTTTPLSPAGADWSSSPKLTANSSGSLVATNQEAPTNIMVTSGELTSEAIRGLLMTREIRENPEEVADLERSRAQAERGEVRWLPEDETGDEADGPSTP